MRGRIDSQDEIFHTFHLDDLVPENHPLRSIKKRADGILKEMSRRFSAACGQTGRPGIPPERLIKALLLQALYSVRSEIQLCEQIGFNMLYRWFLDMTPSDPVDSADRKVSDSSDDDDPGNPTVNFRGEKRRNATHRSIVDGEARLARKGSGKPALLSHSGHVLMENRHGLCLNVAVGEANGRAERRQARLMLERTEKRHGLWPLTVGMDANYREGMFLADLEADGITPHVPMGDRVIRGDSISSGARRKARRRRRTRGYEISQRIRKRIEEVIGWCKDVGGLARARFVGRWKIRQQTEITAAAYNLLRMARLAPGI
jgi:hypothetical protein